MKRIIETITVEDYNLAQAIIKGIEGTESNRGGFYECTIDEVLDKDRVLIATKIHIVEVGIKF